MFRVVACAAIAMACGGEPADGRNDSFGAGDDFIIEETSIESLAVLRVANELSELELETEAGLNSRSAEQIALARAGRDDVLGTSDDREIVSLAQLDSIPFVGPIAFRALFRHADLNDFIDAYRTRLPSTSRTVAIGDLHGDFESTRRALGAAGAIDANDQWIGGDLIVVQVGDTLDRGDGERQILEMVSRLELEARDAGGRYIMLLGNHELMNAAGDFRSVTPVGFSDYTDADGIDRDDPRIVALPPEQRGRAAAFLQGGPQAREFARHNVVAVVGDTAFVHGGLTIRSVDTGLKLINHQARAWLLWDDIKLPFELDADDGPVWNRDLASDETIDCAEVRDTLDAIGVAHVVVGHTVQDAGITSACDDAVWRVDVGLSRFFEGPIEVLELTDSSIAVVAE